MIAYNTNANQVLNVLEQDLKSLSGEQADKIMREIAQALTAAMVVRVHQDGKAADGSKIGTYSPEYLKIRSDQYANAGTYKRGEKKGQAKDTGKYTKGKNKGEARKKYSRGTNPNVILSLTRNMEMDLSVCEQNPAKIPNGYAIGYQNELNIKKLERHENINYNKKILTQLSKEEEALALLIVKNRLNDIFAG